MYMTMAISFIKCKLMTKADILYKPQIPMCTKQQKYYTLYMLNQQ